jgi:peptidoglycan/xylan/chitin deacetylase (PgdA/CDA1 family)
VITPPAIAARRHLVTFSSDDGFRASCLAMAAVFERHGLPACFNVLAADDGSFAGHPSDAQIGIPKGDFALWRELAARGHEIQPHGWHHADKAQLPLAEAQALCERTLARFNAEMPGFAPARAVFNYPYNSTTPELTAWLGARVRAQRGGGEAINPLPSRSLRWLGSSAAGPGNCERHCEAEIARLLARESGWLVYCLHGVEPEGWGPITVSWLDRTLACLRAMPTVAVIPAAMALAQADAAA